MKLTLYSFKSAVIFNPWLPSMLKPEINYNKISNFISSVNPKSTNVTILNGKQIAVVLVIGFLVCKAFHGYYIQFK